SSCESRFATQRPPCMCLMSRWIGVAPNDVRDGAQKARGRMARVGRSAAGFRPRPYASSNALVRMIEASVEKVVLDYLSLASSDNLGQCRGLHARLRRKFSEPRP